MPPNKNKNGRVVPSSDDEAQPPVQPRAQPRAPPARQPLQPSTVHNQTGKVKKSAEIARLTEALRTNDLDREAMRNEIATLKKEIATLMKTRSKRTPRGKRRVAQLKSGATEEELEKFETVEEAARKYTLEETPWLSLQRLKRLYVKDRGTVAGYEEVEEDDEDDEDENKDEDGDNGDGHESVAPLHLEVYKKYFPKEYTAERFSKDLMAVWTSAMGGIRSALIYRVRKSSLQIYGVELAEEILRRRATSLILRRSLGGVTQDGAISYSSFPPCLYPEDATQANLKNKEWRREHLFRNAGLMRVGRAFISGPCSLDPESKGKNGSTVYGEILGIKRVTQGLIAFCSIAYCYGMSPDTEFVRIGGTSGIKYLERFYLYRSLVLKMQDTEAGKKTIELWNSTVFGHPLDPSIDYNSEEWDEEYNELMQAIEDAVEREKDAQQDDGEEDSQQDDGEEGAQQDNGEIDDLGFGDEHGAANRGPNVPLFRDAGDNAIDTTANAGDVGDGSVGGVDVEVKGTDSAQDVQGEQTDTEMEEDAELQPATIGAPNQPQRAEPLEDQRQSDHAGPGGSQGRSASEVARLDSRLAQEQVGEPSDNPDEEPVQQRRGQRRAREDPPAELVTVEAKKRRITRTRPATVQPEPSAGKPRSSTRLKTGRKQ